MRGRIIAAIPAFLIVSFWFVLSGVGTAQEVKLTPYRTEIVFGFDNDRSLQTKSMTLDMSETTTKSPTAILLGDFVSTTGPTSVPETDATVTAELDPQADVVKLVVAVDPTIDTMGAGEFISAVRVGGDGFESINVPVKMTFRSGGPILGGALAVAVLTLGAGIGYLFKYNETNARPVESMKTTKGKKRLKLARIFAGWATALAIVIFGFDSQYLDNPILGAGGLTDWLALVIWGFTAGFSGTTIAEFTASRTTPEPAG